MAADIQPGGDGHPEPIFPDPHPRSSRVSYDARFGATCMIWAMFIGLGILGTVIVLWVLAHLGSIGV